MDEPVETTAAETKPVGVGPWSGPWPTDPRYDAELLRDGDTRNVVDEYRYWTMDAIRADLAARRNPSRALHVAIENWQHDFNIGSMVRTANAFNVAGVHIIGRRHWNRRGAMVTDRYLDVYHHADVAEFLESKLLSQADFRGSGQADFERSGPTDFERPGQADFRRSGPADFGRLSLSDFERLSQADFGRSGPADFERSGRADFRRSGPMDFGRLSLSKPPNPTRVRLPLIGVDNVPGAVAMETYRFPPACVLVFGTESDGLSAEMLAACETVVQITQYGSTRSINAGAAAAIALWAYALQHRAAD